MGSRDLARLSAMSGLGRYVKVLRLFGESKSDWTMPEISAALGIPTSTVYRTVRELVAENLLEPATEAHYRLGAAFVEFDRLVRLTDPLYQAGTTLLHEVAAQARLACVAVLARLYGDTVMCVADARSADCTIGTSYERGRPRPLTRGATSKVILGQLRPRRLTRLLTAVGNESKRPFAASESEFREQLAGIRRRGYCVTRGEVDNGLVGIAAPVSLPEQGLTASLSLVVATKTLDDPTERRLVLLLVSSASLLTEQLRRQQTNPARSQAL
jgi:DNA-binding IclR family transcriptional regulator